MGSETISLKEGTKTKGEKKNRVYHWDLKKVRETEKSWSIPMTLVGDDFLRLNLPQYSLSCYEINDVRDFPW